MTDPEAVLPGDDDPEAPEAAAEPEPVAEPAEEYRPVVDGANPTHTVQEVLDWILDKVGR